MSPETRGPTAQMRRVSRNPSHFRTGRWALVTEGTVLAAFGIVGLCFSATHVGSHVGSDAVGVAVLGLTLTSWHGVVLLATGVALALSSVRRRASVTAAAITAVGYLILVFYGAVAAVHHAPGPLGLGAPSIVLHGFISTISLGILYWLLPDTLAGQAWVRRPRTRRPARLGTRR